MSTRQKSAGIAQFPNMLKVAREIGCQIQPSASNPNILTGLCPFHDAGKLHEAKTLHVDLQTTRFWCIACEITGNPMVFIAKVWGMSAQETYEFISDGREVTAQRPRREQGERRWNEEGGPPEGQNTAVLTLASRHYARNVNTSFTALHYLARLGIEPERAVKAGFGYCDGDGLREYLEARDCTPEEIGESPLFQEMTGLEILSGCLVLSDRDYTGATIWMMGIPPEEPGAGTPWRAGRPRTRGIRGKRNQLFNLKEVNQRSGNTVLTDDPRLHLVLTAGGVPSTMTTQRRRNDNVGTMTERIASLLERRKVNGVILAMHDRELGERISRATVEARPEARTESRSQEEMMRQLDPQERDLERFTRVPTPRREGNRRDQESRGGRRNGNPPGELTERTTETVEETAAVDGAKPTPVMEKVPATEATPGTATELQGPPQPGDSGNGGT